MKSAKLIYKASLDGDVTVEQQIIDAETDIIEGVSHSREMKFEYALRYDITRTVINILSNSSIKYNGATTPFCESLQKKLTDIFFQLHDNGFCFLEVDEKMRILNVSKTNGSIKLVDPAFEITGFTQKVAARKALDMYGVITDVSYSVLSERGIMVMFSPAAGVQILKSRLKKFYESVKYFFGARKGQSKIAVMEFPMQATTVNLPIKEMELLTNKKDAVATVARIYGIGEDMIQGGATFANKQNAIIQTYSDYKGLIYTWINQIESQVISFRNVENYEVTFSGVPQLTQQSQTETIQ